MSLTLVITVCTRVLRSGTFLTPGRVFRAFVFACIHFKVLSRNSIAPRKRTLNDLKIGLKFGLGIDDKFIDQREIFCGKSKTIRSTRKRHLPSVWPIDINYCPYLIALAQFCWRCIVACMTDMIITARFYTHDPKKQISSRHIINSVFSRGSIQLKDHLMLNTHETHAYHELERTVE